MYGLYQQLKALVFGGETAGGKEQSPIMPGAHEPTQLDPQKRYFTGEITSLSETSGMIDEQVFFTTSCVTGCRAPQVGSMVHVVAERPHPLACWHASRVEVTEIWEADQTEERETVIGFISKLSRSLAIVDCATRELIFDPQCHAGGEYHLQTGDWVMMGVRVGGCEEGEEGGEVTVEYVRPLREKETEGRVSSLGRSSGFIDDDIIFTPGVCGRGYVKVGDGVRVKCVECRHHQASWRAISVVPLSSHPHSLPPTPHSPSLPLLTPSQRHTQLPNGTTPSSSGVAELMRNKGGVVIGEECDVGRVIVGREKSITITIRNTRSHDHFLLSVKPLPHDPQLVVSLPPHTHWCTGHHCHQPRAPQRTTDSSDGGESGDICDGGENSNHSDNSDSCGNGDISDNGKSGENRSICDSGDHVEGDCSDGTKVEDEDSHMESGHATGQFGNETGSDGGVICRHVHIPGGGSLDMTVTVKAETLGQVSCLLLFTFSDGVRITRSLTATITSSELDSLGPSSAYRGGRGSGRRVTRAGHHDVVPGEKPSRPKLLRLPTRLKPYPVPEDLWECVCEGEERGVVSLRPQLTEPLCMKNYYSRFSTLLHLEEIQREIDMRNFDLTCVALRRCGQYISLEVPGLAEGRPSLLMGDRVVVSVSGREEESRHWEGYIHETMKNRVLLKFSQDFHQFFDHQDYDIIFQFSRTTFRRMHHAVEYAHLLGSKVLFPGQQMPKRSLLKLPSDESVSSPYQFFNPVLNPCQRAAVRRILAAQSRPAPYIVFGPPGTGKTVTLVEAILQLQQRSRESRVLACAPSNSAADLLTERLVASGLLGVGDVVRLNAIQRPSPPDVLTAYCMYTDSMDIAVRSRVVVSTCMTAGILLSLGLAVGHFSHVFVDEAGQATESVGLLPASLLAGYPDGQLVLSGDPHQLGPVLASKLADSLGLSLSLLERVMTREPYLRDPVKYSDHGAYDPLMVTKLVNNYRSHPLLLRLYSDTFYHGELVPCADTEMTSSMCEWEGLPCGGFPLVFHGVMGEDMREGSSPSWFNPVEIIQVVSYVQSLIDNSTFAPKLSDIGIITPYRKQVEKIRWFLSRVGVEGIKVGSVEEFQGQEKLVIIISTVRSTQDLVTSDLRHHIGFLSNPRRFNVAISRAQALLVVVGNPHLLCQDPHWCVLVQYAVDNGCYTGCPLPPHFSSDHIVQ